MAGKFDDLGTLDQQYYHKCLKRCNYCNSKEDCKQDVRYQTPVIGVTASGRTILDWKYCHRHNDAPSSTVGINSPINKQMKSIDKMLGDL